MKKTTAILLALLLAFGCVSVTVGADPAQGEIYELNKKQTAAALDYITEMYIEKYPEFGLLNEYGGEGDKKVLSDLALSLTENCASDTQKAKVLCDWVADNILYHGSYGYCSYPIDVYYEGIGSGHGFAMLLSRLMRLAGIPAVVFDGLYGDMQNEVTKDDLKDTQPYYGGGWIDYGDGWVMAYIDGKWSLYDPVHGTAGSTDRTEWEKWYFCLFIEGVMPYYEGMDLSLQHDGTGGFYIDGRTMVFREGEQTYFAPSLWYNGMHYNMNHKYMIDGSADAYYYVDTPERKNEMREMQAYYDGFYRFSNSSLYYANPNGVLRMGGTIAYKGEVYDLTDDGLYSFSGCETRQYKYGCPVVLVGETIRVCPFEGMPASGFRITDWTECPDAVTVHPDGSLTVSAPGYVELAFGNVDVGFYVLKSPRTRRITRTSAQTPETIYEMNIKQTAAAIDYITEMYIEKYPDFGLLNEYGGEGDKKVLSDLVDSLTKNCASDEEKARLLSLWVKRNITYDMDYSLCSYPIDVYYEGRAVCHGVAMLLSRLMRLAGIPAVVFDGLHNDLKEIVTKENFDDLRTNKGHAWVMAYFDGMWHLYDPLWDEINVTDRDYWIRWYFCTHIEGVSPYYDGADIELTNRNMGLFYIDGRLIGIYEGVPQDHVEQFLLLNGMVYHANTKMRCPDGFNDGLQYVYTPEKRAEMINTQAYYDGFFTYCGDMLFYADPNGINRSACVVEFEGEVYYLTSGGGEALRFSGCETRQYMHGMPVVLTGETVTIKRFDDGRPLEDDEEPYTYVYTVSEESDHPESVTINADNSITVTEPGYVQIEWLIEEPCSYGAFEFYVLDAPRSRTYPEFTEEPITSADEEKAVVNSENRQVALLPETDAEGLSELLGDGVTVVSADGSTLSGSEKIGTGATVIAADGTAFTVVVPGDTDGDGEIHAADARVALRAAVGLEDLDHTFSTASDMDADGETLAADARTILRISVELESVTKENLAAAAA